MARRADQCGDLAPVIVRMKQDMGDDVGHRVAKRFAFAVDVGDLAGRFVCIQGLEVRPPLLGSVDEQPGNPRP